MRILSEWSQKNIRVTVMHMNDKYILKLEDGLLEQTYKFRDGQVRSVEHLRSMMTDNFLSGVQESFDIMKERQESMIRLEEDSDFDFPVII